MLPLWTIKHPWKAFLRPSWMPNKFHNGSSNYSLFMTYKQGLVTLRITNPLDCSLQSRSWTTWNVYSAWFPRYTYIIYVFIHPCLTLRFFLRRDTRFMQWTFCIIVKVVLVFHSGAVEPAYQSLREAQCDRGTLRWRMAEKVVFQNLTQMVRTAESRSRIGLQWPSEKQSARSRVIPQNTRSLYSQHFAQHTESRNPHEKGGI